tara:strand:+ start:201 stop:380 length:180 start_codon:yes stop_codon:yes gene_type:complete
MAIRVRNSSPSLANVGMELAFLFNVSHDRSESITISDLGVFLEFCEDILFFWATVRTLP